MGRDAAVAASGDGAREGSATPCRSGTFEGGYPVCAGEWVREFGGPNLDGAQSVAVDGSGNVYVAGIIGGQLPGGPAIAGGSFDAYVRKLGANGLVIWTRQFGSAGDDVAESVAVDGSGNVYVAGAAGAALPDQTAFGASDVFVRKYDGAGTELWTRQSGGTGALTLSANGGVGVDGAGNVYLAGTTVGTLPGQTSAGGEDAFVRKYDASGSELWTRQFGTGANDAASAVSADPDGNVYLVGSTFGALPGQTSAGQADAFVRKYDGGGNEAWTHQFGTDTADSATTVQVDAAGIVYVGGSTSGTLPGQTSAGSTDAFVLEYDANGADLGTRQFGTAEIEQDISLSLAPDALYIAGETNGTFSTNKGYFDAFVIRLAR